MNNQDEEQLRLLSVFHYVCAGIAAFCASIPIIHLVLGLVMVFRPAAFGPGQNQPPVFMGWFFVMFASVFIVCGWTFAGLLAWSGRCLSRRRHYMFSFVMACVACTFMPFGTVLGIFTILVLNRPSVKALFGRNSAAPVHP
ncbi:MAG TPA: hypothetical protein VK327_03785 [Candidatus Paceibacterota bacterium]|nr:hypothetical protein [Candidatus Paceibacterota bacterium]